MVSLRHTCLLSIIKNSLFLKEESRNCSDFSFELTCFCENCFIIAPDIKLEVDASAKCFYKMLISVQLSARKADFQGEL